MCKADLACYDPHSMLADPLRSLPKTKAAFVEPMDCLPVSKLPDGWQWIWEIKLDGFTTSSTFCFEFGMLAASPMRSSSETKVSLEKLHQHFLVTHLKGEADCVLDQLKQRAQRSDEPFANLLAELMASCYPNPVFRDDNWYSIEIPLDRCYCAHPEFRHYPISKDQRYVDFMPGLRGKIESDCFPFSFEIREQWKGPMREPLVKERQPGRFYIIDGQLRIIWHWYHNKATVRVFEYRGRHPY